MYCTACGWVAETIISQLVSKEADAALHRLGHRNPQLAAALTAAVPVGAAVIAAWSAPKIVRWLRS